MPKQHRSSTSKCDRKVREAGMGLPTISYTPLSKLVSSSSRPSAALPLFKLFLDP